VRATPGVVFVVRQLLLEVLKGLDRQTNVFLPLISGGNDVQVSTQSHCISLHKSVQYTSSNNKKCEIYLLRDKNTVSYSVQYGVSFLGSSGSSSSGSSLMTGYSTFGGCADCGCIKVGAGVVVVDGAVPEAATALPVS